MKELLLFFIFVLALPMSSFCQNSTLTASSESLKTLKVTQRYDVRRSINGNYQGLFYGYDVGTWLMKSMDSGGWDISTEYLMSAESRRDQSLVEKAVQRTWKSHFTVDAKGNWSTVTGDPVPFYQAFPPRLVADSTLGSTWTTRAVLVLDPEHNGNTVKVPFLAELKVLGSVRWNDQNVTAVSAQFALRYQTGQDANADPNLTSIEGTHNDVIYYDETSGQPVFLRETINQTFEYATPKTVHDEGFQLVFWEGFLPLDVEKTSRAVQDQIDAAGIKNVVVHQSKQGVSLTLKDLLFIADQPVLLPQENQRLSQIAQTLKKIEGRNFLIIGYTADVGSTESQQELSQARALAITKALEKEGIEARRLFYEGRGGSNPVATNTTEAGRAENRRVEILIRND